MARSDPTAWLVEVLEGPHTGLRIPLEGRALPYRAGAGGSVSFGMRQRVKTVWYPGNPVATQLIFGPTLPPTTINGVWRDRYLGEDAAIDLVELFQELCATGVQLRVVWSALDYQGVIAGVDFQPGQPTGGLGDLGWSITFDWGARNGEGPRRVVGDDVSRTMRDDIARAATSFGQLRQLALDVTGVVTELHGLPSTLSAAVGVTVEDLDAEGATALDTLTQAVSDLGFVDEPPPRALESAGAGLGQALDLQADTLDTFSNLFPGVATTSDDPAVLLALYLDRRTVVTLALTALDDAWQALQRVEALTRPAEQVIVRPVVGSDLRDIALLYYGDADLWMRLASANGITEGSRVPDDVHEIVVPLVATSALDPLRQGVPDLGA